MSLSHAIRPLLLLAAVALAGLCAALPASPVHADTDPPPPPTAWIETIYYGGLNDEPYAISAVAENTLKGGAFEIQVVAAWDNAGQAWQTWRPGVPDFVNTLSELTPYRPYWFLLAAAGDAPPPFVDFVIPDPPTPLVTLSGEGSSLNDRGQLRNEQFGPIAAGRYHCEVVVENNADEAFTVQIWGPPSPEGSRAAAILARAQHITAGRFTWPLIVGTGAEAQVAPGVHELSVFGSADAAWTIGCSTDIPVPDPDTGVFVSGEGEDSRVIALPTPGRYTCTTTVRENLDWAGGDDFQPAAFVVYVLEEQDDGTTITAGTLAYAKQITEGQFTSPLIVGTGRTAILTHEASAAAKWTVHCALDAAAGAGA